MTSTSLGRRAHRGGKCLRSIECVGPVLRSLEQFVPIETQGHWTQLDIFRCLVGMAAERQSIHSLQKLVSERPSETTMWHHLGKLGMKHITDVSHRLLVEQVLDVLPKGKKCIFAIDTTDDPYYGEITPSNHKYVIGDRPRKSTTRFYRYITLYLIEQDRKFTLAVLPVEKDVPALDYIKRFLDVIIKAGIEIKVLLLDRAFYTSEIFSYLQEQDIPHIVPVKEQSAEMKRLLSIGRSSRYASYTMGGSHGPLNLRIAIAVQYYKGRYKKHGLLRLGYVTYGIDWKPQKVAKTYRKRFGIEASYRMRNTVRPRTTTKNPTIRYLLALISLLLKNIWVAIKWKYFTQLRRGPRRIEQDTFRFDHYRIIIWTIISKQLKFKHQIPKLRLNG